MKNTDVLRKEIIKRRIYYLKALKKKSIDISSSSLSSYRTLIFNNFCKNINDISFKNINKRINKINFFYQIKNFLYISKFSRINITGDISKENLKKYNKIIVSWAEEKDFSRNGQYYNKYFDLSSKENKNLWFLIYSGRKILKKIKKNIIVFHPQKVRFGFNIILLLKYFFYILFKKNFLLNRVYHECSFDSLIAHNVKNYFKKILKFNYTKKIIFSYESQPFQNSIINLVKKSKKKIILIGYDHSSNPFPVYNVYNSNSPDLLYVHSESSKMFYSKYFKWPKIKIKKTPSIRISKKSKSEFKEKIFLPYDFYSYNEIIDNFASFLNLYRLKEIKPLEVKIHPSRQNSKKHLILKKKIEQIIRDFDYKFSKNSDLSLSIHIGNTSTVIEALEISVPVIHIVCDPIFDLFSSQFWPTLKVYKISSNVYKYSIKKLGKCLIFKNKMSNFQKIHK